MKQPVESTSGTVKTIDLPGTTGKPANAWGKAEQPRVGMPAPPPVWTRYIDSRLKQFCAR